MGRVTESQAGSSTSRQLFRNRTSGNLMDNGSSKGTEKEKSKSLKLPEALPTVQMVRSEKSMPRHLQAKMTELRKDPEKLENFNRLIEYWNDERLDAGAKGQQRDFHEEHMQSLSSRFTREAQSEELRARFKQNDKREKEARQRKSEIAKQTQLAKRAALEEKWKKWEEAQQAARQREAKSEAQKSVKALLVTIQFCARMHRARHKLEAVKNFQKKMSKMVQAATFLQTYWRYNFVPRAQNKLLHAVLLIQTRMRRYFEQSKERRKATACQCLHQYMTDVRNAVKAKSMLKLFMKRLERLQHSMSLCLVKWKYRQAIIMCQWERWEEVNTSTQEPGKKSRRASKIQKKGSVKGAASLKLTRSDSIKEEALPEKTPASPKALKKSGSFKAPKTEPAKPITSRSAKLYVLEKEMEAARKEFFALHLQWKCDLSDFEFSWRQRSFELQLTLMQETELTKPQIQQKIATMKIEETPQEPRWEYMATEEQLQQWQQQALELDLSGNNLPEMEELVKDVIGLPGKVDGANEVKHSASFLGLS